MLRGAILSGAIEEEEQVIIRFKLIIKYLHDQMSFLHLHAFLTTSSFILCNLELLIII